ncbi:MAG: hypothetical protein R3F11_28795 [Verrucomicrobiales bacterium]
MDLVLEIEILDRLFQCFGERVVGGAEFARRTFASNRRRLARRAEDDLRPAPEIGG